MQILPINKNNQTNFQAVNQKYLQMAKWLDMEQQCFQQKEIKMFK